MLALFGFFAGIILNAPLIYYVIGFVCFWLDVGIQGK